MPYWKIAEELRKAGFERTHKQCRDKVKALKKRYEDVIDKLHPSLSLHFAAVRVSSKPN